LEQSRFFIAGVISLAYVFCTWLFDFIWHTGYFAEDLWASGAIFVLASILCGIFIYALKRKKPLSFIEKLTESQPTFMAKKIHKFFFISVLYWPLILFILGSGICIHALMK